MGKDLKKIGKFYSHIIMRCMGLFIFMGAMSVLFMGQGWFPNEELYGITTVVSCYLLPLGIAWEVGKELGDQEGSIVAVLATAGILAAASNADLMAVILVSSLAAWMIKRIWKRMEEHVSTGMEMLCKNLVVGLFGVVCAIISYLCLAPVFQSVNGWLGNACDYLIGHRLIKFASLFIEPAKVFFLNNSVNYGVLTPLGMNQVKESGKSILFLLETNPGPGLGVLLAVCLWNYKKKEQRHSLLLSSAVEFFGGIHEVYFPYVISNLWLLPAVILGGFTGDMCFELLDAGATAPVVPGSMITLLLMSPPEQVPGILLGVIASIFVSFGGCFGILWLQGKRKETACIGNREEKEEKTDRIISENENDKVHQGREMIKNIAFVCDAGVGSSAMGAALMRRKLREHGIEGVEVQAYAADQLPQKLDIILCQKEFRKNLPDREVMVYPVESLLGQEEMEEFIDRYFRER